MKLSPLTIFLICLSVSLIALSYAFFREWMPNSTEAGYYRENAEALAAEANKMPEAQKRVQTAIQMVNEVAAKWQGVVEKKTPAPSLDRGGIDLSQNRWQLTVDARSFRNNIQRAVNAQLRRGGVTIVAGPQIPFPSENATNIVETFFNFPSLPFPVVMFDLGTVTVRGTYDQINAHVRAWSSMPNYLAVADGLVLEGTTPVMLANYNLSIVGFIRGDEIYPPVPEGAAAGGGGGGGGGAPGPGPGPGPRGGGQL